MYTFDITTDEALLIKEALIEYALKLKSYEVPGKGTFTLSDDKFYAEATDGRIRNYNKLRRLASLAQEIADKRR